LGDFFRRSRRNYLPTTFTAIRPKVNDPITGLHDIEVMFNDDHGVAFVSKLVQDIDEFGDIAKRETSRWFIENVNRVFVGHASPFTGQFHSLCFASREGSRWLAKANITETNGVERLQGTVNFSMVFEEFNRFSHWHFENIMNGTTSPLHLQTFSRVPLAVANIARDPNIGKEIHFQFDRTSSTARFAAAAFDVETEMSGLVATLFGELCIGKKAPDFVKHFGVRRRVGTRGSADGGLIDNDDFVDVFHPFNGAVFAWKGFSAVYFPLQCWGENS
jgi:hypothetical protein